MAPSSSRPPRDRWRCRTPFSYTSVSHGISRFHDNFGDWKVGDMSSSPNAGRPGDTLVEDRNDTGLEVAELEWIYKEARRLARNPSHSILVIDENRRIEAPWWLIPCLTIAGMYIAAVAILRFLVASQ